MYAPKLRTWITSEERFLMGLQARIDRMGDEALAEIHDRAKAARERFAEPKPSSPFAGASLGSLVDMLAGLGAGLAAQQPLSSFELQRQAAAMHNIYPNGGYLGGMGNALGGMAHFLNQPRWR